MKLFNSSGSICITLLLFALATSAGAANAAQTEIALAGTRVFPESITSTTDGTNPATLRSFCRPHKKEGAEPALARAMPF